MSQWIPSACVLCKEAKPLTEEHIFPDGIGGCLTAYILCKDCNSKLGHKIDGPYLQQSIVELARNALGVSGKRDHIPQPFSAIYEVPTTHGKLRIRLDEEFKPKVIPDVSGVTIQPDGGLSMSLVVDSAARQEIPGIIRRKLERFFETQDGKALNWTPQQIEDTILRASGPSSTVPANQVPVGQIHERFEVDLRVLFLEHLKVAYEIACIHNKENFVGSARAEEIRDFLYERSRSEKDNDWDLEKIAKQLRIVPQLSHPTANFVIAHLTGNAPHAFHLALITGRHVTISMLGLGLTLTDAIDASGASYAAFINDIQRKTCIIQPI